MVVNGPRRDATWPEQDHVSLRSSSLSTPRQRRKKVTKSLDYPASHTESPIFGTSRPASIVIAYHQRLDTPLLQLTKPVSLAHTPFDTTGSPGAIPPWRKGRSFSQKFPCPSSTNMSAPISRFGTGSLHQRDPRSALFEGYTGDGSRRQYSASPSPSVGGGYGYAGSANGGSSHLGVDGASRQGGYRPAT